MATPLWRRFGLVSIVCVLTAVAGRTAYADEIWVAPSSQADLGGLGVASNTFWPVTAIGAVRFAFAVPSDLQVFQAAKISVIPHTSFGAATLNVFVCPVTNGSLVAAACVGPFSHGFNSVANRLTEVDISTSVAPQLGGPSNRPYLAVLAYTTPGTTTDHLVGLRFTYGQSILTSTSTGLGVDSFKFGSVGTGNTALGSGSMFFGATGSGNTAVGQNSMAGEGVTLSGSENTGVGSNALREARFQSRNTGVGYFALTTPAGPDNTAVGAWALNGEGVIGSTAVGSRALAVTFGCTDCTAVGREAGRSGSRDTSVGAYALSHPQGVGNNSIAIGYRAGILSVGGRFNIHLGHEGAALDFNTLRIGTPFEVTGETGQNRAFIAGIRGITTGASDAVPVVIDSTGQLGTISSSIRFKEDIHDMADASRRLLQLRPVTFRYTQAYVDGAKPIQYGLIAEEVAEVFPELAVRGADGQVETVHYETLNVLLLNEVQKQQRELTSERTSRQEEQHLQQQRIEALEQKLNDLLRERGADRGAPQ